MFGFMNFTFRATTFASLLVYVLGQCIIHLFVSVFSNAALNKADPNDWVNVDYVISQVKGQSHPATADAKATIVRKASSSVSEGPWSKHVLSM